MDNRNPFLAEKLRCLGRPGAFHFGTARTLDALRCMSLQLGSLAVSQPQSGMSPAHEAWLVETTSQRKKKHSAQASFALTHRHRYGSTFLRRRHLRDGQPYQHRGSQRAR
jgi:hypothetical protein